MSSGARTLVIASVLGLAACSRASLLVPSERARDGGGAGGGHGVGGNGGEGAAGPHEAVQEVVAGAAHVCARLASGAVRCWGSNWAGEIGDGTVERRASPSEPVALPGSPSALGAGAASTCSVLQGGDVWCWGRRLESGAPDEVRTAPERLDGLRGPAVAVSGNHAHACALLASGQIDCWGHNYDGELGNGAFSEVASGPVAVVGIDDATHVGVGLSHTCAVRVNGEVFCWGDNNYGQLGVGFVGESATPQGPVVSGAIAVEGGWDHTCALLQSGAVRCWGNNFRGQLGNGGSVDSTYPVKVLDVETATQIAVRLDHSCVVTREGGVICWGSDQRSQIGDGDGGDFREPPTPVASLGDAASVTVGDDSSCASLRAGGVVCWGDGSSGQLGDGRSGDGVESAEPVHVLGL